MNRRYIVFSIILGALVLTGCTTPKYIYDTPSYERQKELMETRTSNVFSDIFLGISSTGVSMAFNSEILLFPVEQQFKKIKLLNPTPDTMYVNMLSDVYWDENDYCDFMDIRIPPQKTCKVMVPLDATYNLYFSNTVESDDDEMLEIQTNNIKNIVLKPGITFVEEDGNELPNQ